MKISDQVKRYIINNRMIMPGERVAVGVSGGADSMCLLFLLNSLSKELGFSIIAVHVEHGIRGQESLDDASYTEEECRKLGIEYRVFHIDAPKLAAERRETLEEAARIERYRIFESVGADKIAVAHHAGDEAETLLFNIFRGSGLKGLGAIAPIRGKVIRPLLELTKSQIIDFCDENEIKFRTDKTNFDNDIARNAIRNQIIPIADKINSASVAHMAKIAASMRDWNDYIEFEADKLEKKYISEDKAGRVRLDTAVFENTKAIMVSEIVRRCILRASGKLKDITAEHINNCMELGRNTSGKSLDIPYGICVKNEFGTLIFEKKSHKSVKDSVNIEVPLNGIINTKDGKRWKFESQSDYDGRIIKDITYTKWFDYDRIVEKPILRTRRTGDYVSIKGGRKKLKDVFIEAKIPASERDSLIILADGSHIIWVPGIRMSECYKVSESTKKIWKVEVENGTQD
ncbi:MAG: tRNA lysidine(34) synthetase TilS [Lachnospiraceae bacterium]|nr:tRNA lysidine(34) synthetase TilS [Lachnospiraceae bacterium]